MKQDYQGEIGIIGGGWYGAHIARKYALKKVKVTLFEANDIIFSGISGKYGVRLHAGPHYPRSPATRESCHQGLEEFSKEYPQLINKHEYSIYGLGNLDANDQPSKVDQEKFKEVCLEFGNSEEINPSEWGYRNLHTAFNIEEPSMVVGERLRKTFEKLLEDVNVNIVYNFTAVSIERRDGGIVITNNKQESYKFNHVINTTSFQAMLPIEKLPFDIEIVYQPCLALVYTDNKEPPLQKPISFIVMDGLFPCLMPYDDRPCGSEEKEIKSMLPSKNYILTHGKWTILGSYKTASQAQDHLNSINDKFIQSVVKPACESDINKFWPEFKKRFQYLRWIGAVIAKIKTEREFRSAVTFQHQLSGTVYVIPGKVSNIFDAEREVMSLTDGTAELVEDKHYSCVRDGILHRAMHEIKEKPTEHSKGRNTCELQPYSDYFRGKDTEKKTTENSDIYKELHVEHQIREEDKESPSKTPITTFMEKVGIIREMELGRTREAHLQSVQNFEQTIP